MSDQQRQLLEQAAAARLRAYAPYSGFRVGAAIVDDRGQVHAGCNVENAAYPQGQCAEATAIGAMVVAGGTRIVSIAVVGGAGEVTGACTPCGGCRQRISEFADERTRVVVLDEHGQPRDYSIGELLPASFALRSPSP